MHAGILSLTRDTSSGDRSDQKGEKQRLLGQIQTQLDHIRKNDPAVKELTLRFYEDTGEAGLGGYSEKKQIQLLQEAMSENCFVTKVKVLGVLTLQGLGRNADPGEVATILQNNLSVCEVESGLSGAEFSPNERLTSLLQANQQRSIAEKHTAFFMDMERRFHRQLYEGLSRGDASALVFFSNQTKREQVSAAYTECLQIAKAIEEGVKSELETLQTHTQQLPTADSAVHSTDIVLSKSQTDLEYFSDQTRRLTELSQAHVAQAEKSKAVEETFSNEALQEKFLQLMQACTIATEYELLSQHYADFLACIGGGVRYPLETHLLMGDRSEHLNACPNGRVPLLIAAQGHQINLFTSMLQRGSDPFFPIVPNASTTVVEVILKLPNKSVRFKLMEAVFSVLQDRSLEEVHCSTNVVALYRERGVMMQVKSALEASVGKLQVGMQHEVDWTLGDYFINWVSRRDYQTNLPFLFFCYYAQLHQMLGVGDKDFEKTLKSIRWVEIMPAFLCSEIYKSIQPALKELERSRLEIKQRDDRLLENAAFRQERQEKVKAQQEMVRVTEEKDRQIEQERREKQALIALLAQHGIYQDPSVFPAVASASDNNIELGAISKR